MYPTKRNMAYRFLGKSGIKVSILGIGNWGNSDQKNADWDKEFISIAQKCFELGINFFDTAEYYGFGNGEKQFGQVFQTLGWARKDYVITSKYKCGGEGVNDWMLSRKHLIEANNLSLERMHQDHLDIVFAHRFDYDTQIEDVCRGFNRIIEDGKALYWGTSEFTPQQIMKVMECCERHDLIKPIVEQPEYSLFVRKNVEADLAPLYDEYGLGATIWAPLAGGILTGKYQKGNPDKTRYSDKYDKGLTEYLRNKYAQCEPKMKEFVEFANELKYSPSQLALAWVLRNTDVSSCIMGSSSVKQVEENMKALELFKIWTPQIESKMESIFKNKPDQVFMFRGFKQKTPRREVTVKYDGDAEFYH